MKDRKELFKGVIIGLFAGFALLAAMSSIWPTTSDYYDNLGSSEVAFYTKNIDGQTYMVAITAKGGVGICKK